MSLLQLGAQLRNSTSQMKLQVPKAKSAIEESEHFQRILSDVCCHELGREGFKTDYSPGTTRCHL